MLRYGCSTNLLDKRTRILPLFISSLCLKIPHRIKTPLRYLIMYIIILNVFWGKIGRDCVCLTLIDSKWESQTLYSSCRVLQLAIFCDAVIAPLLCEVMHLSLTHIQLHATLPSVHTLQITVYMKRHMINVC